MLHELFVTHCTNGTLIMNPFTYIHYTICNIYISLHVCTSPYTFECPCTYPIHLVTPIYLYIPQVCMPPYVCISPYVHMTQYIYMSPKHLCSQKSIHHHMSVQPLSFCMSCITVGLSYSWSTSLLVTCSVLYYF